MGDSLPAGRERMVDGPKIFGRMQISTKVFIELHLAFPTAETALYLRVRNLDIRLSEPNDVADSLRNSLTRSFVIQGGVLLTTTDL